LSKRLTIVLMTGLVGVAGLELGERFAVPGVYGVVASAQARVGRPLTPVSVAGVARRTVGRCPVGMPIYYC
jgi:hypothetical protein